MSETRILNVPAEDRTYQIVPQLRVEKVEFENRVYVVPTEEQEAS